MTESALRADSILSSGLLLVDVKQHVKKVWEPDYLAHCCDIFLFHLGTDQYKVDIAQMKEII